MAIRKLDRDEWEAFFDSVSAHACARTVDVEVLSPALGAQHQGRSVPLIGVSYDPRDDALDVAMKGLEHRIAAPAQIYVDEGPQGLESVEVALGDGSKQILKFAPVLQLPSA